MARRIEIELTSARPDGTWTWRAAGALNPKGVLESSVLYEGAKTGDVVRAEADFGIDGITVVSVEPPRAPRAGDPNRIELIERPNTGGVTTQLASRGRTERGERRHTGTGGRTGGPGERPARAEREPGDRQERANRDRPARATRPFPGPGRGPGRPGRPVETEGERAETAAAGAPAGRRTGGPGRDRAEADGRAAQQRQRRLSVGNAHRNAMLESLPAEQQPIAQQLLRGGIPAVRTALHFEREKAREEGRPEPSTEGVLAIAESLVSRVKAAEWRDRAEAALKAGEDLAMRDLRSLVSGSDVARDEASRDLAVALREALDRRVEAHRSEWATDLVRHLDEGHVLRALRLASRPPDPVARLSAELATRLKDAAGAALAASVPADRWLAVLQAVSESPVRRAVKPEGLPEQATAEQLDVARQQCGRVPGLAPLLGLPVPPPPGPPRPVAPGRAPQRHGQHGPRPGGAPRPSRQAAQPTREVPTEQVVTAQAPVAAADEPSSAAGPTAAVLPEGQEGTVLPEGPEGAVLPEGPEGTVLPVSPAPAPEVPGPAGEVATAPTAGPAEDEQASPGD